MILGPFCFLVAFVVTCTFLVVAFRYKKIVEDMTKELHKLLGSIEVLDDYTKDGYTQLNSVEIEAQTKKAVLIEGLWFPLSQLRCDVDGNVYLASWLYRKNFE